MTKLDLSPEYVQPLPEWEKDGGVWQADAHKDRSSQVWPINDLKPHVVNGGKCWCNPSYDDQYDIVIHNSMDGREKFETGERKFS